MKKMAFIAAVVMVGSLATARSAETFNPQAYVKSTAQAHDKETWFNHDIWKAEMQVTFGGEVRIDGTATFDCWVGKARIDFKDGKTIGFDGEEAWVTPASVDYPKARFDVLTWPYFLAAPVKFGDPGVKLEEYEELPLYGDDNWDTVLMTFGENVGDAPDDWYKIYRDPETGLVESMAYIVTYYSGSDTATAEPHAIVYKDYEEMNGVMVSTRWEFYNWSEEKGVFGEPLGSATIANLRPVSDPDWTVFEVPEGSQIVPLPDKN